MSTRVVSSCHTMVHRAPLKSLSWVSSTPSLHPQALAVLELPQWALLWDCLSRSVTFEETSSLWRMICYVTLLFLIFSADCCVNTCLALLRPASLLRGVCSESRIANGQPRNMEWGLHHKCKLCPSVCPSIHPSFDVGAGNWTPDLSNSSKCS